MYFRLQLVLMILCTMIIRPNFGGEKYSSIAVIICICLLFLSLISKNNLQVKLNRKNKSIAITVTIFWVYCLFQEIILQNNTMGTVAIALLFNFLVLITFTILLSDSRIEKAYFKLVISIFMLLIISYYITVILRVFVDLDKLFLFKFDIPTYENTGKVYFPFTISYSIFTSGNIKLLRLMGTAREAGIFQLFLIWAFFNLNRYGFKKRIHKVIIISGIIATLSTTGVFLFPVGLFIYYFMQGKFSVKKLLTPLIAVIAIIILFNAPYIGLKSKMVTHSASGEKRLEYVIRGLDLLSDNLFGIGIYQDNIIGSGVNLLAISYKIGIIGLIIIISSYFIPLRYVKRKNKYLAYIIPIFITSLITQPLIDATFIYILMMSNDNN